MFKVGDRVICTKVVRDSDKVLGLTGEVIDILASNFYLVFFDDWHDGHTTRERSGWNISGDALELAISLYGPPLPKELEVRRKVTAKCKKLWSKSNFVKGHPEYIF